MSVQTHLSALGKGVGGMDSMGVSGGHNTKRFSKDGISGFFSHEI